MAADLPDDILYLICDELLERRDFGTLFNCCTTGKILATPALSSLYRAQHMSSIKADSNEEAVSLAEQELVIRKWSILWRTLILSALGKTTMPYCKYIRMLDLDDLRNLLEEDRFRISISTIFFSGDLAKFNIVLGPSARTGRRGPRLNISAIIEAVGDLLTNVSPLLETLTGLMSSDALVRWIPRLPKLRHLRLWEGKALGDDRVPNLLHIHCPKLQSIGLFMWLATDHDNPECDEKLAAVFSGLPGQSLKAFTAYSRVEGLGAETCLALNCHGESLTNLELQVDEKAMPYLGLLKGCTALESLKLTDADKAMELEKIQNDVFLEVVSWLCHCHELTSLVLLGFISGGAIVTPVLQQSTIRLEHLEVDNYAPHDRNKLHQALVHQTGIQQLILSAEPMEMRDDVEILLLSVCQLVELRVLRLIGVSTFFGDKDVGALSEHLEHLEDLYVGGLLITDESLESAVHLRNLKSMAFSGMSSFTMEGLLNFVSKLGDGNRGITLAVDNADPDVGLSEQEQMYVRSELQAKVDGRLDYTLMRDPDISEFEGESD